MGRKAKDVDWLGIQKAYSAGIRTTRDIGQEFGISHVAINERAKKDGWVRDLSAKIRAKADEKLTKDFLPGKVTRLDLVSERKLIEANADVQVVIRQEHRQSIKTARQVVDGLLSVLVQEGELAEHMGELKKVLDATPATSKEFKERQERLTELFKQAMAFGEQVKGIKALVDALKSLVEMERLAYGIDARMDEPPTALPEGANPDLIRRMLFLFAQAAAQ